MQLNALLKPFPRVLFRILPALSSTCEVLHLLSYAHANLKKFFKKLFFRQRAEHTPPNKQQENQPAPFIIEIAYWCGNVIHGFLTGLQADYCQMSLNFCSPIVFSLPHYQKGCKLLEDFSWLIKISYSCNFSYLCTPSKQQQNKQTKSW